MKELNLVEIGTYDERLKQLIAHFSNGNAAAFGRVAGIKSGVIGDMMGVRKNKPSFEMLQRVLTGFPTMNPDWLLFGTGPMLRQSDKELAPRAQLSEAEMAGLFSVEWRAWLTVDFLDRPLSVGLCKNTQEPIIPSTGDLFAGLVGEGEQAPLMQVSVRYQLSGRRAYVVEVDVFNVAPVDPEEQRAQLEQNGWSLLPMEARKITPTLATPPW